MVHKNSCNRQFLPVGAFQLNLFIKEPDVCQNNGGYRKVNLPLQSIPFLTEPSRR